MLTRMSWGFTSVALLNLLAMVTLCVAYVWHHWLKRMEERRRVRDRPFERLLSRLTPMGLPAVPDQADARKVERSALTDVPYP